MSHPSPNETKNLGGLRGALANFEGLRQNAATAVHTAAILAELLETEGEVPARNQTFENLHHVLAEARKALEELR